MDFLAQLNEPQRRAVLHGDGPLLVLAGAGSGKTRVITYRIAHLVAARGVDPHQVLAVTFTNKAAGEMRERVRRLLDERGLDVWLGTFHATCARLLRRNAERAGLRPDFTIYDDDDAMALLTRVLRELNLDERAFAPRAVRGRIDRAKQDGLGPQEAVRGGWSDEQFARAYEEYDRRLRAANAVDFGDLLVLAVRLLETDAGLAEALRRRFRHLLVDEFQDTNRIQLRLLAALVNPDRNLCVVGDDDQSIYRWRGAEVRNILEFERHYPGATVVRLEQNYRSTGNVLRAASAVVRRNASRHPKELWTDNPAGDPVRVLVCGDEREEASAVARSVEVLRGHGVRLSEMAVFYRVNAQSRALEEAVRARGLPYVVVGGFRFYDRAEVKTLVAYLRLLVNPADDAAFLRVVNVPPRGIGKVSLERLAAWARAQGIPLAAAATRAGEAPDLPTAGARALAELAGQLEAWRGGAVEGPARIAERIFDESGYRDLLVREKTPESESRLQNVQELLGSIGAYVREEAAPTLGAWLEHVALQASIDDVDPEADRLVLMTVHAAKGLEFDTVFVAGMEEGLFPYRSWDQEVDYAEERQRQEEERRLCYVAMTRARRRLFLLHARVRQLFGGVRPNPPSRFLADIPPEAVAQELLPGAGARDASSRDDDRHLRSWDDDGSRGEPWRRAPVRIRAAGRPERGQAVLREEPEDRLSRREEAEIQRGVAQEAGSDLRVGDRVRHPKFGVGVVAELEGGRELKLQVDFPHWGRKKLMGRFVERA